MNFLQDRAAGDTCVESSIEMCCDLVVPIGAVVYDRRGRLKKPLDLGDARNDMQATPSGHIWVSYFDEGVYGRGVGSHQGLVCFDSAGNPIFKYFDFAEQNDQPFIDDCLPGSSSHLSIQTRSRQIKIGEVEQIDLKRSVGVAPDLVSFHTEMPPLCRVS